MPVHLSWPRVFYVLGVTCNLEMWSIHKTNQTKKKEKWFPQRSCVAYREKKNCNYLPARSRSAHLISKPLQIRGCSSLWATTVGKVLILLWYCVRLKIFKSFRLLFFKVWFENVKKNLDRVCEMAIWSTAGAYRRLKSLSLMYSGKERCT